MRSMSNKTAYISVRVPPELKEALDELSKADKRSLAQYVQIVLQEHVEGASKRGRR